MTRVDLVWFNAGGGHRAAAQALEQVIVTQGRPWTVQRVNLTEVLDPSALFQRMTGFAPEDLYNKRLASGFTLGLAQELRVLQSMIRLGHEALVRRLARHWAATRPDLVVSLIPNFNRCLHDSLALARPGVPFVTVMTDMGDTPPAFWIEPQIEQHLVCGTHHALGQALAQGVPSHRLHLARGMILRPEFHLPQNVDRTAERLALGLPAASPVGLVMFGGTGSRVMRRISSLLPDTPLILMCGRNAVLADQLRRERTAARRVVVGHTSDVSRWMHLADFFVGKPGPGSLSEAVQTGLPVVVTRNAWTMPQERWNTDWVAQNGLGVVLRRFSDIGPAVASLKTELPAYRSRVDRVINRAVFDVPDALERILQNQRAAIAQARC